MYLSYIRKNFFWSIFLFAFYCLKEYLKHWPTRSLNNFHFLSACFSLYCSSIYSFCLLASFLYICLSVFCFFALSHSISVFLFFISLFHCFLSLYLCLFYHFHYFSLSQYAVSLFLSVSLIFSLLLSVKYLYILFVISKKQKWYFFLCRH